MIGGEKHFHLFGKEDKDEDILHYDVVILGGGPAGLTSAIYCSRYGMHTAVIAKDIGGMANMAHKIENYPGFEGSGLELMKKFHDQAKKFHAEFLTAEVLDLRNDKTGFVIELTDGKVVHSKTIILALGTEKRKLEITGEKEFLGRGVSYCVTCDAFFFKNKNVSVIGGGNSACKASLILGKLAKKVYLIYRGESLRCDANEIEKIKDFSNIEIIYNAIPKKIIGKKSVEKLEIEIEGESKEIDVSGVFIEVGAIPATSILKKLGVKIDKDNYIEVNESNETNVPGLFAAGDLIKSKLKQVVIAAGQGAMAAKSAHDFISKS